MSVCCWCLSHSSDSRSSALILLLLFTVCMIGSIEKTDAFVRSGSYDHGVKRINYRTISRSLLRGDGGSSSSDESMTSDSIRLCEFSGNGDVLIAHKGEYDHHLMQSAVLIYDHSNERGTAGVVLDKPSAFTMGEMVPGIGPFKGNTVFQGGADGQDSVLMFHCHDLGGLAKPLRASGLFVGGLKEAKEKLERFEAHPRDFKFIYNNVQWPPGALEKEIAMGRWVACSIAPELVLKQQSSAFGTLWKRARTVLKLDAEGN